MPDDLRQRYAEAIAKAAKNRAFQTSDPAWDGFRKIFLADADAALAVRDDELARLRAEIARVRAVADEWGEPGHCGWVSASVLVRQLRAALDGPDAEGARDV